MEPIPFRATVEPFDVETGTASNGADYLCLRDATVDTGWEIIQRTVIAFGDDAARLEALLEPGLPVILDLVHSGGILKTAGLPPVADRT